MKHMRATFAFEEKKKETGKKNLMQTELPLPSSFFRVSLHRHCL